MGTTDVTCLAAKTFGVACVTMTSTLSRTNSAMIAGERCKRPSPQRYSIVTGLTLDPTEFAQSLNKGGGPLGLRRRSGPAKQSNGRQLPFAVRAPTSGHAAAAPPSNVMNSRRFMPAPPRPMFNDLER